MTRPTTFTSAGEADDAVMLHTPVYVGGYRLGGPTGLQINLTHKPRWFHRTMMRLCLGWEWVDA